MLFSRFLNMVLKLSEVSEIKINQSIKPKNSFKGHEMEYYISTVIITQLSLLTLIVLVAKNKVLPKRVKPGIITATALSMVCAFAEFSGVLLDGAATILKPLHIVVKYIEVCVAPIIPLVFSSAFYPMKSKKMIFCHPLFISLLKHCHSF